MWFAWIQLALAAGLVREERAAWPREDKTRTGTAQAWSTYENVRRAGQGHLAFDSFARDEPTALCWHKTLKAVPTASELAGCAWESRYRLLAVRPWARERGALVWKGSTWHSAPVVELEEYHERDGTLFATCAHYDLAGTSGAVCWQPCPAADATCATKMPATWWAQMAADAWWATAAEQGAGGEALWPASLRSLPAGAPPPAWELEKLLAQRGRTSGFELACTADKHGGGRGVVAWRGQAARAAPVLGWSSVQLFTARYPVKKRDLAAALGTSDRWLAEYLERHDAPRLQRALSTVGFDRHFRPSGTDQVLPAGARVVAAETTPMSSLIVFIEVQAYVTCARYGAGLHDEADTEPREGFVCWRDAEFGGPPGALERADAALEDGPKGLAKVRGEYAPSARHTVFVYGSLLEGLPNHLALGAKAKYRVDLATAWAMQQPLQQDCPDCPPASSVDERLGRSVGDDGAAFRRGDRVVGLRLQGRVALHGDPVLVGQGLAGEAKARERGLAGLDLPGDRVEVLAPPGGGAAPEEPEEWVELRSERGRACHRRQDCRAYRALRTRAAETEAEFLAYACELHRCCEVEALYRGACDPEATVRVFTRRKPAKVQATALVGPFGLFDPDFGFPFLAPEPGPDKAVLGELYEVPGDVLHQLDKLEGHPTFYQREQLDVSGTRAWVYLASDEQTLASLPSSPRVADGDWRTHWLKQEKRRRGESS